MDNCKISHKDNEVNGEFIDNPRNEQESEFENGSVKMKVIQGKKNKYPGINLDCSVKVQVKITIPNYIKETLYCFKNAEPESSGTQ